jgi:DNA-binding NarL/FixJ family response regulator
MPAAVHVLVADSEPVFAAGVAAVLGGSGLHVRAVEPADLDEAVHDVGAVLVDSRLGRGPYAGDLVARVRGTSPGLAIVLVVDRVRPVGLSDALDAGALAIVHRRCSAEELGAAVSAALRGQTWLAGPVASVLREEVAAGSAPPDALTRREFDVLRALAAGGSNASIGSRLGISAHTVRNHVHALLRKLGAANRTDAVTIAVRRGLVDLVP